MSKAKCPMKPNPAKQAQAQTQIWAQGSSPKRQVPRFEVQPSGGNVAQVS